MTETETREIEITKEDSKQTDLAKKSSISNFIDPFFNRISPWFEEFWWPFTNRIRFPLSIMKSKFRMPLANITEDDSMYRIEAEIPGIDKKDIDISIADDRLEIKGESEKESKEEEKGFTRREYKSSSYYRAFNLPNNANKEDVEANLKDGRLEVSIPKIDIEEIEKKKIKIK